MNFYLLFITFFCLNYIVYQRTTLSDIKIELSHDVKNSCKNNIAIQNISNKNIKYEIKVWRGNKWYFKNKLNLSPGEIKWYDDAFITCDNKSEVSIELLKLE